MIGILGGTFDPIHHGHLRLALELLERLQLKEMRLLLSARPPHRNQPMASAQQRLHMLQAALIETPGLYADDRELRRSGPSYMVDTLREIRAELPDEAVCLALGMDAFLGLPTWHEWERLIESAHLVVVRRPDTLALPKSPMAEYLARHRAISAAELHAAPRGKILEEQIPALTISATQIRGLLREGRNPRYLLPETVLQYIHEQHLYQTDDTPNYAN